MSPGRSIGPAELQCAESCKWKMDGCFVRVATLLAWLAAARVATAESGVLAAGYHYVQVSIGWLGGWLLAALFARLAGLSAGWLVVKL